jgi:TatD DNase family protein
MLETDAPYLTPHPHRGQRNEPAYTALIATKLADLLGQPLDIVAAETTAVALRFYGLSALPKVVASEEETETLFHSQ